MTTKKFTLYEKVGAYNFSIGISTNLKGLLVQKREISDY